MTRICLNISGALIGVLISVSSAAADTLDTVKARGYLKCGVNTGLAGFSAPDDKGEWQGIDADFCRAIAAAIFKDKEKVQFSPLTAKERFTALQSGEVDLLSRNTTWTMSRDTTQGLMFAGVMYHDGQGFMVKKTLAIGSVKDLVGASVCVQTGTTNELNLADYFKSNNIRYEPVVFEKNDEAVAAYNANRCDAYTTDTSGLYAERLKLGAVDQHIVLPEIISKEPLGPAVRQGDVKWFNLVRWVHYAMINAEEMGIGKSNVDAAMVNATPEAARLLGLDGDFGKGLGLENDWAFQIIKQVGNYGEAFERNLGEGSRLKIPRGKNKLGRDGGLQTAPPVR